MKHRFQSIKANGTDNTEVQPSNWNDTHVFGVMPASANATLDSTWDVVNVTTGSGTITLTLPPASAGVNAFYIKKVDTGSGTVVINPAGSDTIDGQSNYSLIDTNQYVFIISDGVSRWNVFGAGLP